VIALATAAVALAATVSLLPTYLLSRARSRSHACFERLITTAKGDPLACRPERLSLALARRLPWLEAEASELQASSRHRAQALAYGLATAIMPNAEARARAAGALLGPGALRGGHDPLAPSADRLLGAFHELAAAGPQSHDARLRLLALGSARAIADLHALRALGAGPADQPVTIAIARGALLCLLNEPQPGRQALEQADRTRRQLAPDGRGSARAQLGLLACGGQPANRPTAEAGPYRPAMVALALAKGSVPGRDAAHELLEAPRQPLTGSQRLRIAAPVLDNEQPKAVEALAMFAPRHGPLAALDSEQLHTPWLLLGRTVTDGAVLVDPAAAEQAATHIESLIAALPEGPLACEGAECPLPAALGMPGRILREAARMLWFEAACERARRGDGHATQAAEHARSLTPLHRQHEAAVVELAVGAAERALDALAPSLSALAKLPRVTRTRVLMNQTLALAHLGRFTEAYRSAERAFSEALDADRRPLDSDDPDYASPQIRAADRDAAGWLWGAMALGAGKGGEVSQALAELPEGKLAVLGRWLELAGKDEPHRRPLRWNLSIHAPAVAVLPAVMYVAGRVLPAGDGVEVWLDRLFDAEHRHEPVRAMLARAEAARWRGDAGSERRWLERAARLRDKEVDYRTSVLARLAGLR